MSSRLIEECYLAEEDDALHSDWALCSLIRHIVKGILTSLEAPSLLRQLFTVEKIS